MSDIRVEGMRNADRRILVDFINTLEDISCNLQDPCLDLWASDFDFWIGYVRDSFIHPRLYMEELDLSVGIELEQSNWEALTRRAIAE